MSQPLCPGTTLTGGRRERGELEVGLIRGQAHYVRELQQARLDAAVGVDVADPLHREDEPKAPPRALALDKVQDPVRVERRRRYRLICPLHLEAALEHLGGQF